MFFATSDRNLELFSLEDRVYLGLSSLRPRSPFPGSRRGKSRGVVRSPGQDQDALREKHGRVLR